MLLRDRQVAAAVMPVGPYHSGQEWYEDICDFAETAQIDHTVLDQGEHLVQLHAGRIAERIDVFHRGSNYTSALAHYAIRRELNRQMREGFMKVWAAYALMSFRVNSGPFPSAG